MHEIKIKTEFTGFGIRLSFIRHTHRHVYFILIKIDAMKSSAWENKYSILLHAQSAWDGGKSFACCGHVGEQKRTDLRLDRIMSYIYMRSRVWTQDACLLG